jgi:hypothetical protein
MSGTVLLYCIILGDNRTFPVKIETTETVGILKETIKTTKAAFAHIDADSLDIWKVRETITYTDCSS